MDTGGGLDDAGRPGQGHNPCAGMTKEQMQAAFARDAGSKGPQKIAYDKTKWQLGKTWPVDCKRHEDTLKNRLNTCSEQAENMGRADIRARNKTARANLKKPARLPKKRAAREVVQQKLDRCVQEVHSINVTLAQGQ